jgi:aminoglycoside phosphotransferase family enzyme
MRRLNEGLMLDETIRDRRLEKRDLDRLAALLANFYRHARPSTLSPDHQIAEWKRSLPYNRQLLLTPRLKLPAGLVRRIDRFQAAFLSEAEELLIRRSRARFIVDAHGDLRPEHIWLGEPLQVIDCLEFNPRLRSLDALAEIAFLDLECERLGAAWAGKYLCHHLFGQLPGIENDALFHFYRSNQAMVRARLAIARLLEPNPRKPEKWRPLALAYLRLAYADALKIPRFLRRRAGR